MLDVTGLTIRYGAAVALDHVSLSVGAGERVALIGSNGAGKTTLLNTISGLLRPAGGMVRLRGRLAHVPEGRRLFGSLSVDDNLRLGAWRRARADRDPAWLYDGLPALAALRARRAGTLSGGEQQLVAIGRGLMARPDVLAVDELSLGLAPQAVDLVAGVLAGLDIALLLVEQNAGLALRLCDRAYLLERGRITADGSTAALAADPALTRAYLGGAA